MKNYAFIDSQNVHLSIRDQGWKLDWKKFRQYLPDKYKIEKAFLFIGYLTYNESLYQTLGDAGYILVFKPTVNLRSSDHSMIKGNVDAELVLHTMIQWNNFERAIVVTGDGDFHCLVRHLLIHNKLLHLMVPNRYQYSSLFRALGSHIIFMSSFQDRIQK